METKGRSYGCAEWEGPRTRHKVQLPQVTLMCRQSIVVGVDGVQTGYLSTARALQKSAESGIVAPVRVIGVLMGARLAVRR